MLSKTYGIKSCQFCGAEFEAATANQIYCSPEHTRQASNKKIIQRYHEKKKTKTQERLCDTCGNKLSKYNPDDTCSPCQEGKKEANRIQFLKNIGFSYEVE